MSIQPTVKNSIVDNLASWYKPDLSPAARVKGKALWGADTRTLRSCRILGTVSRMDGLEGALLEIPGRGLVRGVSGHLYAIPVRA